MPRDSGTFRPAPPPTARFVMQSIDRSSGNIVGAYRFFDDRMRLVGQRSVPTYRFDPRTRPWYNARDTSIHATAPYAFFTSREVGFSMSQRSAAGSVLAVDVDLGSVSTQLADLKPTPSSQAALVLPDGLVLAYSDPAAFARLVTDGVHGRLPRVSDLGAPALTDVFTTVTPQEGRLLHVYRDPQGHNWLSHRASVPAIGVFLLAAPEDDLLGRAAAVRNESMLLSFGLALLLLPALVLLVSRSTAAPLLHAKIAAEEAAKLKSDFLANMSHEIRTPLNAVIGLAYLTLKTKLEPLQEDYVRRISESGEHLLGIINVILDISKIEAGKLSVETTDITIASVLATVKNLVAEKAESKGLALSFDVASGVAPALRGDPLRLSQVLINFCNNSVKFSRARRDQREGERRRGHAERPSSCALTSPIPGSV